MISERSSRISSLTPLASPLRLSVSSAVDSFFPVFCTRIGCLKNRFDSPDVGTVIRRRSLESANVQRIVLLRQNEATRRLHFVQAVKKMR